MPTITIRATVAEKADIERRAALAGLDVSAFVRNALDIEREAPDLDRRIDGIDRRVHTLEQMAGLE